MSLITVGRQSWYVSCFRMKALDDYLPLVKNVAFLVLILLFLFNFSTVDFYCILIYVDRSERDHSERSLSLVIFEKFFII